MTRQNSPLDAGHAMKALRRARAFYIGGMSRMLRIHPERAYPSRNEPIEKGERLFG
jgi:hypothetical protein